MVNGMLKRGDGEKVAIGVVPAGSGNALSLDLYGEEATLDEVGERICNLQTKKIDVSLLSRGEKSCFVLSMVGWVNVAKRAEQFRWASWILGGYRYKLASLLEAISPSFKYEGKIVINNNETFEGIFPFMIASNTEHIASSTIACPGGSEEYSSSTLQLNF